MSTATPQPTTPPSDSEHVADEVEALFALMAASGPQPRLRGLNGTCQFDLAGAGTWRATITEGTLTVAKGTDDTSPARCTVACDARDFVRFVRREGNMNLMTAYMRELVTVTGDLPFAYAALNGFVPSPEGDHPQDGNRPHVENLENAESQGATP